MLQSTCNWNGCNNKRASNSKYCVQHKKEARQHWLDMIKEQGAERERQQAFFKEVFDEAHRLGQIAAADHTPTPMVVQEHTNQLDDNSPVKQQWIVGGGVCGFAWVIIKPGNCAAANYAKKHCGASKHYYGGVSIWVGEYGQSMELKQAYARAFADHLAKHLGDKVTVYAGSRMD